MSGTTPDSVNYPTVGYGLAVALDEGTGTYNWATLTESGTGDPVRMLAQGEDANIDIKLEPKGTGTVRFDLGSVGTLSVGVDKVNYTIIAGGLTGAPVTYTATGEANTDIRFVLPGRGLVNVPRLAIGNNTTGAATASPRVFTLTAAPGLTGAGGQAFRVGGNVFGTNLSASLSGYYVFSADTDNVTFSNTSNGLTLNYRGHSLASGWSGGRTTDLSFLSLAAAGTAGTGSFLVSGGSEVRTSASMGGTPGAERGSVFARNEIAQIQNGSGPHVNEVVADEFNVSIESQAQALWKEGVKVVYYNQDARRGLQMDFAYSVGMQAAGRKPGPLIAYALGGVSGWWPLKETSHVMEGITEGGIVGGPEPAIGAGIDFSNLTRIRESAFKSIGFKVDGSGNLGATVASGGTLQTSGSVVAKTAAVSAIEVLDGGVYGGAITITVPGGATAAVNVWGIVASFSIGANGSGYVVGDTFEVSGGTTTGKATFTGSISGNVLTVTAVSSGTITNRSVLVGDNIVIGTRIIALGTGAGGTGTYIVDTSQVAASATIEAAGPAVGVVTRVNGTGGVLGFLITNPGRYTALPSSPASTLATSGIGTGFTFSPVYTILSVNVTGGGGGYGEFLPPVPTTSATIGVYRPASFKVSMTATQGALSLNPGGGLNIAAADLTNAVDDAAAAAAGVPVGRLYRNGSILMVRVT